MLEDIIRRAAALGLDIHALTNFMEDPEGALKLGRIQIGADYVGPDEPFCTATMTLSLLKESKAFVIESLLEDAYFLEQLPFSRNEKISVIDIGANVGLFSVSARHRFPNAKIHAYEPFKGLEPYLSHQAFGCRIRYFLEAVGKERGFAKLDNRQNNLLHSESVAMLDFTKEGDIPVTPLSETIERIGGRVDLLKMDCEGSEWVILTDHEALKKVDWLTLEYHRFSPDSSIDVCDPWLDIHALAKSRVEEGGFTVKAYRAQSKDAGILLAQRSDLCLTRQIERSQY